MFNDAQKIPSVYLKQLTFEEDISIKDGRQYQLWYPELLEKPEICVIGHALVHIRKIM